MKKESTRRISKRRKKRNTIGQQRRGKGIGEEEHGKEGDWHRVQHHTVKYQAGVQGVSSAYKMHDTDAPIVDPSLDIHLPAASLVATLYPLHGLCIRGRDEGEEISAVDVQMFIIPFESHRFWVWTVQEIETKENSVVMSKYSSPWPLGFGSTSLLNLPIAYLLEAWMAVMLVFLFACLFVCFSTIPGLL